MKLTIALLALVALCAEIRAGSDCDGWIYGGDTDCTWRDTAYCQTRFGRRSSCKQADCGDGNFSGRPTRVCSNNGGRPNPNPGPQPQPYPRPQPQPNPRPQPQPYPRPQPQPNPRPQPQPYPRPQPQPNPRPPQPTRPDCNGWIYGGDTDCTWRDTNYCQTRFGRRSSCKEADCGDGNNSGRPTRVCCDRNNPPNPGPQPRPNPSPQPQPYPRPQPQPYPRPQPQPYPRPQPQPYPRPPQPTNDCDDWIYGGDTDCTWRDTNYCQTRFGRRSSCQPSNCEAKGNFSGRESRVCVNRA